MSREDMMPDYQKRWHEKQKAQKELLDTFKQKNPEEYKKALARVKHKLANLPELLEEQNGFITAWRAWEIVDTKEGLRLYSQNDTIWEPYEALKATCKAKHRVSHEAPDPDCMCGIYGTTSPGNILGHIIGKVALWGVYERGEKGWKAQYGYPLEFTHFLCSACSWSQSVSDLKGLRLSPFIKSNEADVRLQAQFLCRNHKIELSTLSHLLIPAAFVYDKLIETYGLAEPQETIASFMGEDING